jgi:hypothetical protein
MKFLILFLLFTSSAFAQCKIQAPLHAAPVTGRGGTLVWKSNWNLSANREQTIAEGNHSAKGATFLVYYKSKALVPNLQTIEVRDVNCKLIAKMGRYPRCTSTGCGEYERWYLRAPGSSRMSVPALSEKAGGPILIQLKGKQWGRVTNVFDNREIRK